MPPISFDLSTVTSLYAVAMQNKLCNLPSQNPPPPTKEVSWYCNFDRMSQKSVNCYARGLGMAMTTCATVMHKNS
jgi:hypothetical protein